MLPIIRELPRLPFQVNGRIFWHTFLFLVQCWTRHEVLIHCNFIMYMLMKGLTTLWHIYWYNAGTLVSKFPGRSLSITDNVAENQKWIVNFVNSEECQKKRPSLWLCDGVLIDGKMSSFEMWSESVGGTVSCLQAGFPQSMTWRLTAFTDLLCLSRRHPRKSSSFREFPARMIKNQVCLSTTE